MKQKKFGDALAALTGGCTKILGEITIFEDTVVDDAKNELCKTPEDIMKSRTAARLIAKTEQKAGDVLDIKNSEISALSVYAKLVTKTPMTKKERDYLSWFFTYDKTQKTAQDILSKINLLYGDENSDFIDSFLKNEDGKLDIFWFVEYITKQLEDYKLIIPDNAEDIKKLGEVDNGICYSFTANGKIGLSVVSEGEIFFLFDNLEKAKLLDNGMIFGVENFPSDTKGIPDRKKGFLYKFYDKKGISEIHGMPEVVDLDIIQLLSGELSTVFKTQNENGKKGLLEMAKESEEETLWDFKDLLMGKDNILVNDKFITMVTFREKINTYDTYIKLQDIGIPCGFLRRIDTTITKKGNPYFELNNLGDNLISIRTNEGQSIYKFNKEASILESIDSALMNMSFVNMDDLLSGKPTVVTKEEVGKGGLGLYIFNKKACKVTMLIKETNFTHSVNGDQIESRADNKRYIHYWKDGVLYRLKKGYKYNYNHGAGYIQKGIFGNQFYIDENFENTKEFLEQIDENLLPIDLKSI